MEQKNHTVELTLFCEKIEKGSDIATLGPKLKKTRQMCPGFACNISFMF